MLQVDLVAKRARNLSALQKIDENVLEIVSEASHTALYKFDAASTKWERFAVEGAVFITRNCLPPFYSLIVLNKMGPDDFILDMSTVQKAKIQDSYVMLRYSTGGAPIIMGFWLRDDSEREELLQSVTRAITASNNAGTSGKASSFPSSLTMKLTAAAQQISIKKVTTSAPAPVPTPPASYAAALGISKHPTPSPTTPAGSSMQTSSSALAIMQAIGSSGTGTSISSSGVSVVSMGSPGDTSNGTGGGAGMGLLKMLRAQPAPTTTTTTAGNNMASTVAIASISSSSTSGQAFLTDREISAMKTNQHHPSSNDQGGISAGSSGGINSSTVNVFNSSVVSGSGGGVGVGVTAGNTAGSSSKGATNMLLAALQISTNVTSGLGSPVPESVPSSVPSSSPGTRMIPIPLSALLGK